jgi:CheY-like chemotaxis protein
MDCARFVFERSVNRESLFALTPSRRTSTPNRSVGLKAPNLGRSGKGKRRSQNPPRILVVDDVPDVTEMISLFLRHAGYQVSTAPSAQEALRQARARKFDMVISDIGMPQMNGYELAGELRALEKYKRIPMIAVTGYSEYDDRGRAVRAGFNVHLTKPIDPAGLLNLIGELLA